MRSEEKRPGSALRARRPGAGPERPENAGGPGLLSPALSGDEEALTALVDRLTPVIQARVARHLLRRRPDLSPSRLRARLEELVQEVFLHLFADGGAALAGWRPDGGLSLENFAGLIAERRTISLLRPRRQRAWSEQPTADADLDGPSAIPDPERRAAARERLDLLLDRLRSEVTPEAWHLFELLFVEERSIREAMEITGKSRDAIYAWRSRLRRAAVRIAEKVPSDSPTGGEDTRRGRAGP